VGGPSLHCTILTEISRPEPSGHPIGSSFLRLGVLQQKIVEFEDGFDTDRSNSRDMHYPLCMIIYIAWEE
jgi:hypothetical protein